MTKVQQDRGSVWTVVRMMAAVTLAVAAFAFGNAQPAVADGSCAPADGSKCIASSGTVYDEKQCQGGSCISCQPRPGWICTGFGSDEGNYYDPNDP